jgi:hypothetical protein
MRFWFLVDWKEILPVMGATTPKPPQVWGVVWGTNSLKNIIKIKKYHAQLPKSAISLEEWLRPNDSLTKMGVIGKFLGVVFTTP